MFSGKRGGYTEQDLRDGTTFYDRTKALGELEDNKNLTLRNSIIGRTSMRKESGCSIGSCNKRANQWLFKSDVDRPDYTSISKNYGTGCKGKSERPDQCSSDDSISKYDLLRLFNKYFRAGSIQINPNNDFVADKSLKRTRFEFSYRIPDYEKMVYELHEWVMAHRRSIPITIYNYHQKDKACVN